jgi:hypothetical protein
MGCFLISIFYFPCQWFGNQFNCKSCKHNLGELIKYAVPKKKNASALRGFQNLLMASLSCWVTDKQLVLFSTT